MTATTNTEPLTAAEILGGQVSPSGDPRSDALLLPDGRPDPRTTSRDSVPIRDAEVIDLRPRRSTADGAIDGGLVARRPPHPRHSAASAPALPPVVSSPRQDASLGQPPRKHPLRNRPAAGPIPIDDADATDLRRKLASMPVIEQAKGLMMGLFGCDADTAYVVLRRWSQDRNIKIRDLCTTLTVAAARPHPNPFGALHDYLKTHRLI